MKLNYFKRKLVCTVLLFLILLQSCSVYKKENSTFDEAIATGSNVKATTADGTKYIIKKIRKVDNQYYGVIKYNGKTLQKNSITESDYKTIQLKDQSTSTIITAGIIAVPVAVLTIIAINSATQTVVDIYTAPFK
jgi:hypothetical protein